MRNIKTKVIKAMAILNLAILLLFSFSLLRYYHPHQLPDGTIIWHSHPFSANHGCLPTHQHKGGGTSIVDNLFSGQADLVISFSKAVITEYHIQQYDNLTESIYKSCAYLQLSLRGPPVN